MAAALKCRLGAKTHRNQERKPVNLAKKNKQTVRAVMK